MTPLRNERGGVLLYAILLVSMLALAAALLMGMHTSRAAANLTSKHFAIANQMTYSAMESAIAEWNEQIASGRSLRQVMSEYTGWTHTTIPPFSSIRLPDGIVITHSQWLCADTECTEVLPLPLPETGENAVYYVRMRTVAGDINGNHAADERQAREQSVFKSVQVTQGEDGEPILKIIDLDDPGTEPVCLPAASTLLYGGDSSTLESFVELDIRDAIVRHMDKQSGKVGTKLESYARVPDAVSCETYYGVSYCSLTQLELLIDQMDKSKPRVVRVKRINEQASGTLGSSPSQPIVLIVDQLLAPSLENVTLYGDLIVTGEGGSQAIHMSGRNLRLALHPGLNEHGANDFGNLYVLTNSTLSNLQLDIEASQGDVYFGGDFIVKQTSAVIRAKKVIVNGKLETSSTSLHLAATSGNIIAGAIDFSNASAQVNSFQGDLYVRDNFYIAPNMGLRVEVEGVIAVGNNVQVPNYMAWALTANGRHSSLFIPGISVPCN